MCQTYGLPTTAASRSISGNVRLAAKLMDGVNSLLNNPTLKGISKALNVVAGGLGSVSVTEADGVSSVQQHSVTLSLDKEQTISTNAKSGGPGSADLIYYLKNVKFVWFTRRVGKLQVIVI